MNDNTNIVIMPPESGAPPPAEMLETQAILNSTTATVSDSSPQAAAVTAEAAKEQATEAAEAPFNPSFLPELKEYAKFNYKDIDKVIQETYSYDGSNFSTVCDVMAVYLNGQKILYTEAKTYCELRLNYLMLPAIMITSVCTILSVVLKDYGFGSTIVSCLNGINVFLLALINYLKLDAKAEAHRTTAYKFDKLQSNLVFNSGKILFIEGAFKDLGKIINETENNVREIKETNQFVLPETVRLFFPILCNINVFAEVKKIQIDEMKYINELKDILNELYIYGKYLETLKTEKKIPSAEELTHFQCLLSKQKEKTNTIISIKKKLLEIDKLLEDELKIQRERKLASRCHPCRWLKT